MDVKIEIKNSDSNEGCSLISVEPSKGSFERAYALSAAENPEVRPQLMN